MKPATEQILCFLPAAILCRSPAVTVASNIYSCAFLTRLKEIKKKTLGIRGLLHLEAFFLLRRQYCAQHVWLLAVCWWRSKTDLWPKPIPHLLSAQHAIEWVSSGVQVRQQHTDTAEVHLQRLRAVWPPRSTGRPDGQSRQRLLEPN